MSAAASHGQNGPGGGTLWNRSLANSLGPGRGLPSDPVAIDRFDSEGAYGVEVLWGRGLLTPFSRLRWSGHGKQFSVGSEFGLQPASPDTSPLNLELEGVRGKSSRGADLGVRFRMSVLRRGPVQSFPFPSHKVRPRSRDLEGAGEARLIR